MGHQQMGLHLLSGLDCSHHTVGYHLRLYCDYAGNSYAAVAASRVAFAD
jgi:hypothetical protein